MLNSFTLFRVVGAGIVLLCAPLSSGFGSPNENRAISRGTATEVLPGGYRTEPLAAISESKNAPDRSENPASQKRTEVLEGSDIEGAIRSVLAPDQEKKVVRVVDYSKVSIANGAVSFPLAGA